MSVRLMSAVFDSCLPPRLKSLAVVLANYANDDGTAIRPSIRTIAADWSHSERRTQAAMADLRKTGVLVVVRRWSPSRPTEYRIDVARLTHFRLNGQDLGRSKTQISTGFSTGRGKKNQGVLEFSTVSTGINRTIAVAVGDATVTRSVMIQESTSTSTARARGPKPKANAR